MIRQKLVFALLLLLGYAPVFAQRITNVTISPQSGSVISAKTNASNEEGYAAGYGSLWKHEQVPLTYTTTDLPMFSADGVLANHTCNIRAYKRSTWAKEKLIHIAGYFNSYAVLAMPKGYRILSYKIELSRSLSSTDDYNVLDGAFANLKMGHASVNPWTFGEIDKDQMRHKGQTADEPTWKKSVVFTKSNEKLTLERKLEGEKTNSLYFCFRGAGSNQLRGLVYESIEITYAPDVEFEEQLFPNATSTSEVSLSQNAIGLQKMDIGGITQRAKDGAYFTSYDQTMVKEMLGDVMLYNSKGHDGKTWKESSNTTDKTISSVHIRGEKEGKLWYALKDETYYVETPTKAKMYKEDGQVYETPIGYRIVGAEIDYTYGKSQSTGGGFYIGTQIGNQYQYLQLDGTWGNSYFYVWRQLPDGRIYTTYNSATYYLTTQYIYQATATQFQNYEIYSITTTTDASKATNRWRFNNNECLYYLGTTGRKLYLRGSDSKQGIAYDAYHNPNTYIVPAYLSYYEEEDYYAIRVLQGTPFTPVEYYIDIYDPVKGDEVIRTVQVTSTTKDGTIRFSDLNNDAIKFRIRTKSTTGKALVNIRLKLEPLNPYISTVDVVCTGKYGEEITRTLGSSDFHIGGETFVYKVPTDFKLNTNTAQFTFRNAKSDYSDATYKNRRSYTGDNARFSFVKSVYYENINEDLYANKTRVAGYEDDYLDKVSVKEVGNKAFTFNNAADLGNTAAWTGTKYLQEFPFSKSAYAQEGGNFSTNNAVVADGTNKQMFLFTADETRYNIAPTTKEQHFAYAYYYTNIKLQMSDYTPVVEWKKIYDKTLYHNGTDAKASEAMYGAYIKTSEMSGYDNDYTYRTKYGYLSLSKIMEAMQANLGGANAPSSLKQVLYVDNSDLFSVVSSAEPNTEGAVTLAQFRAQLAANALIYLPYNAATWASMNHASSASGVAVSREYTLMDQLLGKPKAYTSDANLILKDRNPFYAPFDIQLSADKYATYARELTYNGKGSTSYVPVVLPFALTLNGSGKHIDPLGNTQGVADFEVYEMKDNGFIYDESTATKHPINYNYIAKTRFTLAEGNASKANNGYMLKLPYQIVNNNVSLIINEKASLIVSSERLQLTNGGSPTNLLFATRTVTTTKGTDVSNFTEYGSYAGVTIANNAENADVFYFSINRFLALKNTKNTKVYLHPFRSFYKFGTTVSTLSKIGEIEMAFDDIDENTTTGINDVAEEATLIVKTDKQVIMAKARQTTALSIHTISGQTIVNTTIHPEETLTFYVPQGLYIINGQKITVK